MLHATTPPKLISLHLCYGANSFRSVIEDRIHCYLGKPSEISNSGKSFGAACIFLIK